MNIGDKFKKISKSVKDSVKRNVGKYTLLGALALGSVGYASGQDYVDLPTSDPYSVIYISKKAYGGADFNNMNAEEKEDFFDSRIKANIRYPMDNGLNQNCTNYAKRMQLIFTGLDNFNNFEGKDENNDGVKEGYNYYNPLVELQKENIPLYLITDKTLDGIGHMIVGAFIGSKNSEDNPTDWHQWRFWNYENGEKITPGHEMMNPNGPCDISQLTQYKSFITGKEIQGEFQILSFDLNEGIGTLNTSFGDPDNPQGYHRDILLENPHKETMKLKEVSDKYIERGLDAPNLSVNKLGKPEIETSLEHYTPEITFEDSQKEYFDSRYPEYFSFTRKFIADVKMGRWNKSSSLEQKITVDDKTPPEVSLDSNQIVGEKGTDPKDLAKSAINSVFDASTAYGYPVDTLITGTDSPSFEDNDFYYYDVQISAKDVQENTSISQDLEVKVKKLGTGIEKLNIESSFKLYANYPNPANSSTRIRYFSQGGTVTFNLTDITGKTIKIFTANNSIFGENEIEIELSKLNSGMYVISGIDKNGNTDKIKLIIKNLR